jgi:nucleoside-diphosphate-sugar epimerase
MQTILGSGGVIANGIAEALPQYTDKIRLVSRHPKKVNETDELFPADLTDLAQIDTAVAGSEVVYVTIGFEYNIKVWQQRWIPFINATIAACQNHKAKLVFFDNVYMYDPQYIPHMTEETPINPSSQKGKVRAEIVRLIMNAVQSGKLTALIARAADFYGPNIVLRSFMNETVYENFKKGKAANWFADATKVHTYTFTPDAGKATALLGNTPDSYNQVWHLPTDSTRLTGKDWIELFAREMNVAPKYSVLPPFMISILGLVIPFMKELREMLYQYDQDYVFDSSKFEKRFGIKATTPAAGVKATVGNA